MSERDFLAGLAPMFRYPECVPHSEVSELQPFFDEVAALDLAQLQAAYTSTFDLAPACSPYLGDHLFGEEHRDRARLMAGLRTRYGGTHRELPDHIAEVLAHAARFDEHEWRDLRRLVLLPALRKMSATLAASSTPYRHLVAAAARLFEENPS